MGALERVGFTGGLASPCAFKHEVHKLCVSARGEEVILLGSDVDLDWLEKSCRGRLRRRRASVQERTDRFD